MNKIVKLSYVIVFVFGFMVYIGIHGYDNLHGKEFDKHIQILNANEMDLIRGGCVDSSCVGDGIACYVEGQWNTCDDCCYYCANAQTGSIGPIGYCPVCCGTESFGDCGRYWWWSVCIGFSSVGTCGFLWTQC